MANDSYEQDQAIRRVILFAGHVQGVGFRYTTQQVAARFAVTGYVRNLTDGRVQVVAEGTPDELDRFQAGVERAMVGHIENTTVSEAPSTREFSGFGIAY